MITIYLLVKLVLAPKNNSFASSCVIEYILVESKRTVLRVVRSSKLLFLFVIA